MERCHLLFSAGTAGDGDQEGCWSRRMPGSHEIFAYHTDARFFPVHIRFEVSEHHLPALDGVDLRGCKLLWPWQGTEVASRGGRFCGRKQL